MAALRVAAERPYHAAIEQACATALRVDPSAEVRLAVIKLLASNLRAEASVRVLLEWAANNDQADRVTLAAREALNPTRRDKRGS